MEDDFTTMLLVVAAAITFILVLFKITSLYRNYGRPPLPPGPKGLPIIGNINDLPPKGMFEAHHWLKHKDIYGPVSSVTVFGKTIVIINDLDIALDVLEKRAAKTSSRPRSPYLGEMVGWARGTGLCPYNDTLRTQRKNLARVIGSRTSALYFKELQEAESARYLRRILERPDELTEHIRTEAGAVVLKMSYGYTAEPFKKDPLVDLAEDMIGRVSITMSQGAVMVDVFPFLKHLPSWLPGMKFKRVAKKWADELLDFVNVPSQFVHKQKAMGRDDRSFLSQLIEKGNEDEEEIENNKWSAMALYAAGADTTVSTLCGFLMAMIIHPDVQRKAQEEIDAVIGNERLPTWDDRDNLPYIQALVTEAYRWHPVGPLSLPHHSTEDVIVNGYVIPEGATILPNIWHFTHDPARHPNPMAFSPERFIATKDHEPELDSRRTAFGFGRRICPGRVLAEQTVYLNIVQTLAVFEIGNKMDANGQPIIPQITFTNGVISHPGEFEYSIKPRSEHHEKLVRGLEKKFPWEEGDADKLDEMVERSKEDLFW